VVLSKASIKYNMKTKKHNAIASLLLAGKLNVSNHGTP
jgi:hypothetical protein